MSIFGPTNQWHVLVDGHGEYTVRVVRSRAVVSYAELLKDVELDQDSAYYIEIASSPNLNDEEIVWEEKLLSDTIENSSEISKIRIRIFVKQSTVPILFVNVASTKLYEFLSTFNFSECLIYFFRKRYFNSGVFGQKRIPLPLYQSILREEDYHVIFPELEMYEALSFRIEFPNDKPCILVPSNFEKILRDFKIEVKFIGNQPFTETQIRNCINFFKYYGKQPYGIVRKEDMEKLRPNYYETNFEQNNKMQNLIQKRDEGEISDSLFDITSNALIVSSWRKGEKSGWNAVLRKLTELLTPFSATDWRLKAPRGILLYGPPGTGKTSLLHLVSSSLGLEVLFNGSVSDLNKKFVGEAEETLRKWKADAESRPYKLFFVGLDEIDSLVMRQEGQNQNTPSHKLDLLKSLLQLVGSVPNILFMGCTNFKEKLDETFTRANRMSNYIYVPSCSEEERNFFFEHTFPIITAFLASRADTKSLLKKATQNFTIAQLLQLDQEFSNSPHFQDKLIFPTSQSIGADVVKLLNGNTVSNDFLELRNWFRKQNLTDPNSRRLFERLQDYCRCLFECIYRVSQTSAQTKGQLSTLNRLLYAASEHLLSDPNPCMLVGEKMMGFSEPIRTNFSQVFEGARHSLTGSLFGVVPLGLYGVEIGGGLLLEETIWKYCIGSCSSTISLSIINATIDLTKAEQIHQIDSNFRIKHGDDFETALQGVLSTSKAYFELFKAPTLVVVHVDELIGIVPHSFTVSKSTGHTDTIGTSVAKSESASRTIGESWSTAQSKSTAEADTITKGQSWSSTKSTSTTAGTTTTVGTSVSNSVGASAGMSLFGPQVSVSTNVSVGVSASFSGSTSNTNSESTSTSENESTSTCVTVSNSKTLTRGKNVSTAATVGHTLTDQSSRAFQLQTSEAHTTQVLYPKWVHALNMLRRESNRNIDEGFPYVLYLFHGINPSEISFIEPPIPPEIVNIVNGPSAVE